MQLYNTKLRNKFCLLADDTEEKILHKNMILKIYLEKMYYLSKSLSPEKLE